EMLLHRTARHAVSTARAQHVSRRVTLTSAASFKHHAQTGRGIFDRLDLRAVLDVDAQACQMVAQNGFSSPLRQAALKFILAADPSESGGRELIQARSEQLDLPDAHAGAKKWLDQASPVDDVERRRLQCGPASLVMRRQSALDDARLDTVPREFGRREQSGRTSPHDENGSGLGVTNSTARKRHEGSLCFKTRSLQFYGRKRTCIWFRNGGEGDRQTIFRRRSH